MKRRKFIGLFAGLVAALSCGKIPTVVDGREKEVAQTLWRNPGDPPGQLRIVGRHYTYIIQDDLCADHEIHLREHIRVSKLLENKL